MLKCFVITDSHGYSYFKKSFDFDFEKINKDLLGGMLSALTTFGKELFKKSLARVFFGENMEVNLTIIKKETYSSEKSIFFVFICEGDMSAKEMNKISTDIFIQTKSFLMHPSHERRFPSARVERTIGKYF
jgi:hypothetical protein